MPTSSPEGKGWTLQVLGALAGRVPLRRVVDVGAGSGTYHVLLSDVLREARWLGVEVWGPYVRRFRLEERYDEVVVADARYLAWDRLGAADLALFGDIVEHMSRAEGVELLGRALGHARFVLVSLPVVPMPQEAVHDNPFERHVEEEWTHGEALAQLPCVATFARDGDIGVYLLAADEGDRELAATLDGGGAPAAASPSPTPHDRMAALLTAAKAADWLGVEGLARGLLEERSDQAIIKLFVQSLLGQGRWADAVGELERRIEADPAEPALYEALAGCHVRKGDGAAALLALVDGAARSTDAERMRELAQGLVYSSS